MKISCPTCKAKYVVGAKKSPRFCSFCGNRLEAGSETTLSEEISIVSGETPSPEAVKFSIGPYQILQEIGKGGMGEVFLAFDLSCGRKIALKRIRSDLSEHVQMHNRFLKEARITSQLTHPSIIPIYAIQAQEQQSYYTMPYVEGETLKQILRKARVRERRGEKTDEAGASIPALVRIFLNICQAIAYAHSKHVLHRDIKPENIIVGPYGEVLILDWGLAKLLHNNNEEENIEIPTHPLHHLTLAGKVVGTVSYMAPERATGHPATFQTDIYSLGSILYQILTLRHPFKRGTLQEFRETMHLEKLQDPVTVAPYREVPRVLARIAMKCLDPQVDKRYKSVDELIQDVKNYIEGRAEWFQIATLDLNNKSDWEFQENVLIAEHTAITRSIEVADWVNLMISKASYSPNIKLEARVRIGEKSHGLGFLLSIPEAAERRQLNEGYCLWLGTAENRATKLLSSTVEVIHQPDTFLKADVWHQICIEKVENHIRLFLDGLLQFSYISYFPLMGTHVGLLSRDADFEMDHLTVFVSSQSVMVNCLAVPDAFLAQKDFTTALSEYRRIGYSFPGRAEGREGMFRAGVTLLEQAKKSPELYDLALAEFEKLRPTSGAPFEYLGKALVYQAQGEYEEEMKCFELAFRRYPRHPLLNVLQESLVFRMLSSSHSHRQAAYSFMLLALRFLPHITQDNNAKRLFTSLKKHWEPLFFIEGEGDIATILAFWLAKPYVLLEIIEGLKDEVAICNALYCLMELGAVEAVEKKLEQLGPGRRFDLLRAKSPEQSPEQLLQQVKGALDRSSERAIVAMMQRNPEAAETLFQALQPLERLSEEGALQIDRCRIWAFLQQKEWAKAGELLHHYSFEQLTQETNPLFFLYGCWLYASEGSEIAAIHLSGILDLPFPTTGALGSHYLYGRISNPEWLQSAFMWEKRQLYAELALYYSCAGEEQLAEEQTVLARKCYLF